MIKSVKTSLIIISGPLLAWFLPWCYTFISASPVWSPFTLYSCITHCFAYIDFDQNGNVYGKDFKGNTYTEHQTDSIMPLFYYRQLASEGRLPAEIEGVPVTVETAERTGFIFRTSPYDVNRRKPEIYQLLESVPDRVDFKAPDDVFRITDNGIEFIDMKTNSINGEKSTLFTDAMVSCGFSFPARIVSGNGSPKKEYDNGYLILDSTGRLFHLKQEHGIPVVKDTRVRTQTDIEHIFVTEFPDRKLLGFVSDTENRFYGIETSDYSLHEIPVSGFDPERQEMTIIGDMLYWTITVSDLEKEHLVAMNARTWEQADTYTREQEIQTWEKISGYLFPAALSFTSPLDSYIQPRLSGLSFRALWAGLILAALYAFIRRKKAKPALIAECGAVAVCGIFLFIPLLVFSPRE